MTQQFEIRFRVGEAIMDAVVGRKAPLSDSDVIGEVARLRYENAKLRAVAAVAYDACEELEGHGLYCISKLRGALAAAGYGGGE